MTEPNAPDFGPNAPTFLSWDSSQPNGGRPPTAPHHASTTRRRVSSNASAGFNPDWFSDPELWDTAMLAGVQLPGLVRVSGVTGRKIDVRSPPGADGATIADKGYEPAKPRLTVTLYEPAHLDRWEQLLPTLNPRQDARRRVPVSIFHPALNQLQIRQVYVVSISALEPGSVPQTWQSTIETLEYAPIRNRPTHVARPTAQVTFSDTATTPPGSPNAAPTPPARPSANRRP